jgi:hypothetical protein
MPEVFGHQNDAHGRDQQERIRIEDWRSERRQPEPRSLGKS